MLWFLAVCFIPAFVLSLAATSIMKKLAPAIGLIDQPAARKVHVTPTPMGGGLAIYFAFLLPIISAQVIVPFIQNGILPEAWVPAEIAQHLDGVLFRANELWILLGCATILVIIGFLDDRFGLTWKLRLAMQFGVAITLVITGISASVFVSAPWFGQVISVFWIVALINSLNFLDNMDGLSAGIGLIAALMFASVMLFFVGEPRWLVGGCLLVLAGALGGFLCFNWPPASIFMGDAGSTFIGLMLASLTLLGTFYNDSISQRHVMLAPLCVLAIPLYDLITVVFIRLREGRSPFQPDKKHFSHRLADLGLGKKYAVLTVHFATLTTGLGALLLYRVEGWHGAILVVSLVLCVLVIISILEFAPASQGEVLTGESSAKKD